MEKNSSGYLLPYIIHHKLKNKYTAYIPYKSTNTKINEIGSNTYLISEFLDLSTERVDYSPSYSYSYDKFIHEIGIAGSELDKIYSSIKNIQAKLKIFNCEINENLEKITIEIYDF